MTPPSSEAARPRRVLIVSGAMGEGHDAAGRALAVAAEKLWPGTVVDWVDVLDAMGGGIGSLFRRIYAGSVEHWPWGYEHFYATLWGWRWFARAANDSSARGPDDALSRCWRGIGPIW